MTVENVEKKATKGRKKTAKAVVAEPVVEEVKEAVVEEVVEAKPEKEKPKKHENGDLIECMNAYPGKVIFCARKTGTTYIFEGEDEVEMILYEDLRTEALNRRSSIIYDPQIVIMDESFLDEFPRIRSVYDDAYTSSELRELMLNEPVKKMRQVLASVPENVKARAKVVAATLIDDGRMDSISKLQVLDEILETDFAIKTGA